MNDSFKDVVSKLADSPNTLEWTTDNGDTLTGVLYAQDNRLLLNVSTKSLTKALEFKYIYRESEMSGRRVLHPFLLSDRYRLNVDSMYETTIVEIQLMIDEHNFPAELLNENRVTFTYDSFVWIDVPEDRKGESAIRKTLSKMYGTKTSIGDVSVDFPISDSRSRHPGKFEKSMDKLTVSLVPKAPFSDDEIIMWNERIRQFLTFIHKERVITTSIKKDNANIVVPHLIEDYAEAHYAFRSPIFLDEFVEIIKKALPVFIDRYDEIADFIQDLSQYYYDYPLDPPDSIQLLRLFTALEQCADFAQKEESPLSKALLDDEKSRKSEFKRMLKYIKPDAGLFPDAYSYLQDKTMSYFVSSGSKTTPKYKIPAMAKLLQSEYGVHSYLTDETVVELQLKMRNMLAHGVFKPEVHSEFYKRRDDIGQATEQCLRMYLFRVFGSEGEVVIKHSEPLKARQFNHLV
jgi:hypothetical protein